MCWWCWTMPGFFSGEFSIALITVMLWLRRQKTMMTMLMMTITIIVMVTLHHVFSGPGPRGGEGGRWTAIGRWSAGLPDDDDMMTWWYHMMISHDDIIASAISIIMIITMNLNGLTDSLGSLAGSQEREGQCTQKRSCLIFIFDFDDFDEYQHHLMFKLSAL